MCIFCYKVHMQVDCRIHGWPWPEKKFGKLKKWTVQKFKNVCQAGHNMVKSSNPNMPSTWFIFLRPRTDASLQTCHPSASSVLAVQISRCVIAVFMFRKQKRRMAKSVNTHNRLKHFLTNKIFLLQVMYRYVRTMIFIVKCVTITHFFIACAAFWWRSMIFIVLLSLKTVHDIVQYSTVQILYFLLLNRLLRIRLKHQSPSLSYVWEREREKVHCKCTIQCTVHFIITLFKVENVLLCVIYQLNLHCYTVCCFNLFFIVPTHARNRLITTVGRRLQPTLWTGLLSTQPPAHSMTVSTR
jgi:hypothetical protein